MNRVGLIVTGGEIDQDLLQGLLKERDWAYVMGVDHGGDALYHAGQVPDQVIGDFDSIQKEALEAYRRQGVVMTQYPSQKDQTDTHIAMEVMAEKKLAHVTLLGGLGRRQDHGLANLMVGFKYLDQMRIQFLDPWNDIRLFQGPAQFKISGKKSGFFSLLPVSKQVRGVTVTGAKYPLKKASLKREDSIGISNEFLGQAVTITIDSGHGFFIQAKDG